MITNGQWSDILYDIRHVRKKVGYDLKFKSNDGKLYEIHSVKDNGILVGPEGDVGITKEYFNGKSYDHVQTRFVMLKYLTLDELI